MALIKCPECGQEVSDKAPTCPHCGVQIAGKLVPPPVPFQPTPSAEPKLQNQPDQPEPPKKKKKNSVGLIIVLVAFVFAFLVCGTVYYFYRSASNDKEQEAYEYAMTSSDPMVLQSYLDNYKDADEAHIDSIQAHLKLLNQVDMEWTNAVVSGSKDALLKYMEQYPNSPHKQEAQEKIDSIDWNVAKNADNADAYQLYLDQHSDGSHIEEAENALKKVKGRDLQPEEQQMISGLFRRFFQSINTHNTEGLKATCEDVLSSLLGKADATKADVATFMEKLYKENVSSMTWQINNDYKVSKREIGDNEYEYQVQFTARQDVDYMDDTEASNNYKITSTVSPDGKITSFNMAKVTAAEE